MKQRSPAFFALIIIGVLLVIAGLIYGLSSRQTSYKSVPQGNIAHYLASDGTGYLQMEGDKALYVVHEDNFTPKISSFADGDTISFVYDPGETTSVDVTSTLGTHLLGTAAKVVEITASATNGQTMYKTPEYAADTQGYNHNQWGIGIALIIVGLLLAAGSFFLPKKKMPAMITPAPFGGASINGLPPQQYPHPQQGAAQYPQQSYPPQYPPQYPPAQPSYQPQPGPFQQTPYTGEPQQPDPYGQSPTAYGQPQPQSDPYGQLQQPNQQGQYPNPYGQPPQQQNL